MKTLFLLIFLMSSISLAKDPVLSYGDCVKTLRESFYQKHCGKYEIIKIDKYEISKRGILYGGFILSDKEVCKGRTSFFEDSVQKIQKSQEWLKMYEPVECNIVPKINDLPYGVKIKTKVSELPYGI